MFALPSLFLSEQERLYYGFATEAKRTWSIDAKLPLNDRCFIFSEKTQVFSRHKIVTTQHPLFLPSANVNARELSVNLIVNSDL